MGTTLGPLAEYLLAARGRNGQTLCKLGSLVVSAAAFTASASSSYYAYPASNNHLVVEVYYAFSPRIVPGAFTINRLYRGVSILSGTLTDLLISQGYNTWQEIMATDPVITYITNTTAVAQYYETLSMYLIVEKKEDWTELRTLIDLHGGVITPTPSIKPVPRGIFI